MILALKKTFMPPVNEVSDGRKSVRYNFAEPCRVERWGKTYHAMTRNISEGGVALDIVGMGSSALDAELTVFIRDFEPLVAESRWTHKRTFGLKFISNPAEHEQLQQLIATLKAGY